ncbi:related to citrate synthase [Rhynchosporium secalis]|uniref:Citrate synthase n=1 Tax=Rhynchosporium secalis TaxID=38038 RepID=A0A1E1M2S5_RHYSE|nr:related to citrate synthase [Rhynchosporium secalis]
MNLNTTDSLSITDNRTGNIYDFPIVNNSIEAVSFKQIKCSPEGRHPGDQFENGLKLFDPGFQNTACMKSQICFVDGNAGQISYRGISVPDLYLSGRPFEHVAFLLIYGHLPAADEATAFQKSLVETPLPPQSVFDLIKTFPLESHPTTAIASALTAFVASKPQKIPAACGKNIYKGNMTLVDAEVPKFLQIYAILAAAVYCHLQGRQFEPPRQEYSYVENVLHMMRFLDESTGKPDSRIVNILSRHWILTADHELTNSTAAFLHAASTLSDPYSCSAVATLSGTGILHGGAMEVSHKQMEAVGDLSNVPQLIEDVKIGKKRLFGYGHRTYKVKDPRARFIHDLISEASNFSKVAKDDKGLQIALEIDRIASQDEYFVSRDLCANIDLFLSHVYNAIGLPANFILPMSLLGRNPGMIAHWREAMSDPKPRMWRPLQIYSGKVPVAED